MSWQNDLKKMLGITAPMITMTGDSGRTDYFKFQNGKFYRSDMSPNDWEEILLVERSGFIQTGLLSDRKSFENTAGAIILDNTMSSFISFAKFWKGDGSYTVKVKGFKI